MDIYKVYDLFMILGFEYEMISYVTWFYGN